MREETLEINSISANIQGQLVEVGNKVDNHSTTMTSRGISAHDNPCVNFDNENQHLPLV